MTSEYCVLPKKRKILIVYIATLAGSLGPIAGNIYVPILPQLENVFAASRSAIAGTVSVFMAVFAFCPLIWASWADYGGRKFLYILPLSFFIIANVLLASVPANLVSLYILRVVQAFGASSVMSVGAGIISDIIEPKHRGKAISVFMWGPQLGPVLGPVLSLIAIGDWRWVFGFLALLGFVVYLMILFLLPETLRFLVGDGSCLGKGYFVQPRIQEKVVEGYSRPPKPSLVGYWELLKYPPVLLCSINSGILFATFYGVMVTFASVLQDQYHFTDVGTCLSYLCPGTALIIGSTIGGWLSDRLASRAKNYVPEHRFSIQIAGLLISMTGILGYAWTVEKMAPVHPVFVFTFLAGFGMTWVFVSTTTYLTETSPSQPSANVAIGNLMRNMAAAICTAIVDILIDKMGFGWCMTGLALLDLIGICFVAILLKWGPRWRAKKTEPSE
ncbi:uncharacterized protein LODBEIA_P16400 [Lodderomyces beijingensis]|uniref:Major facilitator superfamily (MFS) profile domain-containing protein n=1 Tax=Lodderomyces beijingensis TaxID=1775926 RepID=A0ABP0ZJV6_9ASCO